MMHVQPLQLSFIILRQGVKNADHLPQKHY